MPARNAEPTKFLRVIQLSAGTTSANFLAYLLACLLTISFFVFFNSTQTFVLSIILKVPTNTLGSANGDLIFYDQILSILLLGTWGALSDRIGRRVIFVIGFATMGLSMLGFSYARNLYPQLLILRMLFGVGAAASSGMVTAVLADYIGERDKGKVSGIVGLMSGMGALIGAFVLLGLPSYLNQSFDDLQASLHYSYLLIGTVSILFAVTLALTLRSPDHGDVFTAAFWRRVWKLESNGEYLPVNEQSELALSDQSDFDEKKIEISEEPPEPLEDVSYPVSSCPFSGASSSNARNGNEERLGCTMPGVLEHQDMSYKSFWLLVLEGFKLGWNRPSLLLAYIGGFIARGDSIIITVFLPVWINKYFIDHGLCKPSSPHITRGGFEDPLKICDEAFKKAYMYSGIAQTCALIGAPFFGFLSDRLSKSSAFLVASIFSFLGYFPLTFVEDPVHSKSIYVLMVILGLGEIGMIVTSLSMATSNVPKAIRGSVSGCYSFFGGVGVLVLTKFGGMLADTWVTGPFFLVGVMSGIAAIGSILVSIFDWRRKRLERRNQ